MSTLNLKKISVMTMTTIQCTELKIGRNASEFNMFYLFNKNGWREIAIRIKLLTKTVEKTTPK